RAVGEHRGLRSDAKEPGLPGIHGEGREAGQARCSPVRRRVNGLRAGRGDVLMPTATAAYIEEAEEIVTRLLTDPPQDPYPLYARRRAIDPIHRAAIGDFWTLTRYEDIHSALKDRRFVRDYDDFRRRNSRGPVDYNRPFIRSQRLWFVFYNPPEYV